MYFDKYVEQLELIDQDIYDQWQPPSGYELEQMKQKRAYIEGYIGGLATRIDDVIANGPTFTIEDLKTGETLSVNYDNCTEMKELIEKTFRPYFSYLFEEQVK